MEQKLPFDHAFTAKDDPTVKETYADGVGLIVIHSGTARLALTVSRADEPKPNRKGPPTGQKVIAARLVMPLSGLADLYNKLDQLMNGLAQEGLVHREQDGGVKPTVQ